jgi:hypothetical protein
MILSSYLWAVVGLVGILRGASVTAAASTSYSNSTSSPAVVFVPGAATTSASDPAAIPGGECWATKTVTCVETTTATCKPSTVYCTVTVTQPAHQ